MNKIRMNTTLEVPPFGTLEQGETYEVDEATAAGLIKDGAACQYKPVSKPTKEKPKDKKEI